MISRPTEKDSDRVTDRFFVIASDNCWVHVYPDVQSMLRATDLGSGFPGAAEFFDVEGRRLAPVFSGSWTLSGLRQTGEIANEAAVQRRLRAVMRALRATVDERLAKGDVPVTRAQVLAALPNLNGEDLVECFTLLAANFGDGNGLPGEGMRPMHNGSFLHNLICHGG